VQREIAVGEVAAAIAVLPGEEVIVTTGQGGAVKAWNAETVELVSSEQQIVVKYWEAVRR
jgi:hypothetical protein